MGKMSRYLRSWPQRTQAEIWQGVCGMKRDTHLIMRKKTSPRIRIHPSTVYELIAKGKFPAPFKLVPGGRASCWLETTIDAWLQERADSGGKI